LLRMAAAVNAYGNPFGAAFQKQALPIKNFVL